MNRQERLGLYQGEIAKIIEAGNGFALFEDAAKPERIVQIGPDVMEATNHYVEDPPRVLEPGLMALGFTIGEDFGYPMLPGIVIEEIATSELIDSAFLALGAAPDFTVVQAFTEAGSKSWSGGELIEDRENIVVRTDDPEAQELLKELKAHQRLDEVAPPPPAKPEMSALGPVVAAAILSLAVVLLILVILSK